jgi:nitroreductase
VDVREAIRTRRSIKRFTARPVPRDTVESLLELAVLAPNHRMTQPLRFRVLGSEARRAYGAVLGARKAKRVEDPEAARLVVEKVAAAEEAVPVTILVSTTLDENPEIREEDYATAMMAVEHLCLGACAVGLGTHIRTGAVMNDPRSREALGVPEGERVVAAVQMGEPAEIPDAKSRRPASEVTDWLP